MSVFESKTFVSSIDSGLSCVPAIENLANRSIMVTGSTGLIGSALVATLARAAEKHVDGLRVYAAGRSVNKIDALFGRYVDSGFVVPVEYHAERVTRLDSPVDYIVHAASNAHPALFASDPVGTIEANVLGQKRMLDFARSHGTKRVVYVSSGEVYGEISEDVGAYAEDMAGTGKVSLSDPRSAYTESKRMTEVLCVSYAQQFGSDVVIVRPSHTYGPNQTPTDSRAHAQFLRSAAGGKDIVMKSAGLQVRSYTYVVDCASGILTALLNGESGEAYNISHHLATCSIADFAAMCASTGRVAVIHEGDDGVLPGCPISKQVLDDAKLRSLGWHGLFSCEEGIRLSVEALKELDVSPRR